MALIRVSDASFSYGTESIFSRVNFTVEKGEIFCLLGPNGCGKTTLLECILGILKLGEGKVFLNGQDTSKFRSGQVAKHAAYVPQKHERTFPYSVFEIVKMGRTAHIGLFGTPTQSDEEIARDALDLFGLSHFSDRPYTQLSGGESQLVMIARAFAQATPIIVMDEPTAHLDFRHELIIMENIVQLAKDKGISILMATHFPNHAFHFQNAGVKTTVALLHKGSILAAGSPDEVISEEKMRRLYSVHATMVSFNANGKQGLKQIVPISTINTNSSQR